MATSIKFFIVCGKILSVFLNFLNNNIFQIFPNLYKIVKLFYDS